jgi:hypothetical protein
MNLDDDLKLRIAKKMSAPRLSEGELTHLQRRMRGAIQKRIEKIEE